MIVFAYPLAFMLLLLPFVFYLLMPRIKGIYGNALKFPFITDLKRISIASGGIWSQNNNLVFSKKFWFMCAIWCLLCVSAARPQIVGEPIRLKNESRNIMLVLDISTSMLEKDFSIANQRISRLDAVKKVVSDFTDKRANDRIGLILFGTRAYLQVPLTYDKASVKDVLWAMQAGMAGDSTSIGDALALALKNLHNNPNAKDSVIILLTDGENNDGSLSLGEAIKLAADENIKTYTIGVGSPHIFFNMLSIARPNVDEQGLDLLAKSTQGQYFRAESTNDLQKIYQLIDQLEATSNDERYVKEVTELYYIPLLIALLVLAIVIYFLKGAE